VELKDRLATTAEIVRLGEKEGDRESAFVGQSWKILDALELGDMAAVDRAMVQAADLQ
jgi:hypothetical protein